MFLEIFAIHDVNTQTYGPMAPMVVLFQWSAIGLTQMRNSLRIDSEWVHQHYVLAYQLLLYLVIVPKFVVSIASTCEPLSTALQFFHKSTQIG